MIEIAKILTDQNIKSEQISENVLVLKKDKTNIFNAIYDNIAKNQKIKIFVFLSEDQYSKEIEIELFKAGVFDVCTYGVNTEEKNNVFKERLKKAFKN